jgi:phosphatidylserine synthase
MNEPDRLHPDEPGAPAEGGRLRRKGIYILPNLFTLAALFGGFYAIVMAMNGRFENAAIGVFCAMVLDSLDGRVARMTHTQSAFGEQMDSLSDMVSFGAAPALIMYEWSLKGLGKLGWIAAFVVANLFTGEMATFLARWIENITGRYIAAGAILFAGTLVLANMMGKLANQVVNATGLTLLDRLLGTAFGFARGIIIVLVVVYLLRHLAPPQNLLWLDQAQLMPHVDMLGQWAQTLFSRYQSGQGLVVPG